MNRFIRPLPAVLGSAGLLSLVGCTGSLVQLSSFQPYTGADRVVIVYNPAQSPVQVTAVDGEEVDATGLVDGGIDLQPGTHHLMLYLPSEGATWQVNIQVMAGLKYTLYYADPDHVWLGDASEDPVFASSQTINNWYLAEDTMAASSAIVDVGAEIVEPTLPPLYIGGGGGRSFAPVRDHPYAGGPPSRGAPPSRSSPPSIPHAPRPSGGGGRSGSGGGGGGGHSGGGGGGGHGGGGGGGGSGHTK